MRIFVLFVLPAILGPGRTLAQDREGTSSLALRVLAINERSVDPEFVGRLHGQLSEFTSHIRLVRTEKVPSSLRVQVQRARQELRHEPAAAIVWLSLRRSPGAPQSGSFRARLAILLAEQQDGQGERLLVSDLSQRASRSSLLEEAAIISRETLLAWKRMERVGDDPEQTVERIELKDNAVEQDSPGAPPTNAVERTEATVSANTETKQGEPTGDRDAGLSTMLSLGAGISHALDGQSRLGAGGLSLDLGLERAPFRLSLQGTLGQWGSFSDTYTDIDVRSHRLSVRGATVFAREGPLGFEVAASLGVCADELQPSAKHARVINLSDAALVTFCAGADILARVAITPALSLEVGLGLTLQAETLQAQYKAAFDTPRHSLWLLRPYGTIRLNYGFSFL